MNALFSMSIVDIVLAVIMLLSVLGGCLRGIIKSISWLPGLVFGFLAVRFFNKDLMMLLYNNSENLSPMVCSLISVVVLMAGVYLIIRLLASIFAGFLEDIGLSAFDKILGGLFALAFTFMVIGFLTVVLDQLPILEDFKATLADSWLMINIINPFFHSTIGMVKEAL